jgi:nicotinate-nucleotide adenylyltransferase
VRIGVLGGTFDPVHYGHLGLARDAARDAALDKVLFMPARIQPFKQDARVSPDADREKMLELAAAGAGDFEVTDVETSREGVSYTIDSLRRLRDGYGGYGSGGNATGTEWFFIIGADMFTNMGKWREHDRLLGEFTCVVGRRPGSDEDGINAAAELFRKEYGATILFADNERMDISSSEIRRRVRAGEDLRGLTPDEVIAYIDSRGLYRQA